MQESTTDRTLAVIAEVAVENSGQHQTLVQQMVDALLVCLNAGHTILRERTRCWTCHAHQIHPRTGPSRTIRKEAYALKYVLDDDGFEYVQLDEQVSIETDHVWKEGQHLKLSAGTCHAHGGLVTHYLGGDHGDCLTLRGVDLARHDAATGLILREAQFAEPTARTRAKETNIVGNLHQGASNDVESAVSFDEGIMTSKRLKLSQHQSIAPVRDGNTYLVRRSLEFQTGNF